MEKEKPQENHEPSEKIIEREIESEMKESYLNYSMSVIVGRALPDIRDGLKPVHKRILFAMKDMGMFHNKPYKKSARIVGETLGKYHPHGDMAVYDSLVRLTQPFSLRYPLIDGQGNFGSIDGDSAAAMRYTEARLNRLAEEMLEDLDKDTVDFTDNFDGSLKEPSVLPAKLPNLLINGSSGIAVGMATNIPPHNLREVVDATVQVIDNPEIEIEEIMNYLKGPDFPTGGIICGRNGIVNAYMSGRGKVIVRAKYLVEEKGVKRKIIVNEIPYMVNKAELIKTMADLVRDKKVVGISDLRDESDRDGMRIVIELKNDANHEIVANQLFVHTRMQVTFGIIMLALVDNRPKVVNIKEALTEYISHRKNIVTRRTKFELKKAEERSHILEGIIKALSDVDLAIKTIKDSSTVDDARSSLMSHFMITEIQANAILDLKLQKLASLEQEKIRKEQEGLLETIAKLKHILSDEGEILKIIKGELLEIKEKYQDTRRTEISSNEMTELDMEDIIEEEDVVITITKNGYIKRQSMQSYKQQKRGGVGIIAAGTREEDFVKDIFITNTHSYVLFFTDKGKVYWLKGYYIPDGSRQSQGKAIVNLIRLDPGEQITAHIPIKKFEEGKYLLMCTRNGIIKKTDIRSFAKPRKGGIIAINLQEQDKLIGVTQTNGAQKIVLATKNGMAIRFNEGDVRAVGRGASGVIGIRLKRDDKVISMVEAEEGSCLLTITEKGYGKRTKMDEYRVIGRSGFGVINIITNDRNGGVSSVLSVHDEDEFMSITKKGVAIRAAVSGISVIGRNTQGVRIMKLREDDKVVSSTILLEEENVEES